MPKAKKSKVPQPPGADYCQEPGCPYFVAIVRGKYQPHFKDDDRRMDGPCPGGGRMYDANRDGRQHMDAIQQAFHIASGVESISYAGTLGTGSIVIDLVLYDDSPTTVYEVAGVKSSLQDQKIPIELGRIRASEKRRQIPAECPQCQVGWSHCRLPSSHKQKARQLLVG